jgi:hypothetical protein
MKVQTDEKGEYFITLPTGRDYTFTVNRKGYLFYSEQYVLSKKEADSTYQKNIALQAIALNANFVFNNILFKNNSYELPTAAFIELNKLLQVLNENPSIKLEISGHTDNVGKQEEIAVSHLFAEYEDFKNMSSGTEALVSLGVLAFLGAIFMVSVKRR